MEAKRPLRVLIVDPDPTVRGVLRAMLSFDCCDVRTAWDGASALAEAADLRPDVVLLEVDLPDESGFSLCRTLRRGAGGPRVIFVTGRASLGDRRRGNRAGGDAYLIKPFSPLEVLRLIGVDDALEVAV